MYVNLGSQRLLFGAHEGERLRDVPTSYLTWMARTIEDLGSDERRVVEAECRERTGRYAGGHPNGTPNYAATPQLPDGVTPTLLLDVISAGRQTLAKRFHPDATGGDLERMKCVNIAADLLEQQARQFAAMPGGAR